MMFFDSKKAGGLPRQHTIMRERKCAHEHPRNKGGGHTYNEKHKWEEKWQLISLEMRRGDQMAAIKALDSLDIGPLDAMICAEAQYDGDQYGSEVFTESPGKIYCDAIRGAHFAVADWFVARGVSPALAASSLLLGMMAGDLGRDNLQQHIHRYPDLAGIDDLPLTAIADVRDNPANLDRYPRFGPAILGVLADRGMLAQHALGYADWMMENDVPAILSTSCCAMTAADLVLQGIKEGYLGDEDNAKYNRQLRASLQAGVSFLRTPFRLRNGLGEVANRAVEARNELETATLELIEAIGRPRHMRAYSPALCIDACQTGKLDDMPLESLLSEAPRMLFRGLPAEEYVHCVLRNHPNVRTDWDASVRLLDILLESRNYSAAKQFLEQNWDGGHDYVSRRPQDVEAAIAECTKKSSPNYRSEFCIYVASSEFVVANMTTLPRLRVVMQIRPDITQLIEQMTPGKLQREAFDLVVSQ